MCVQVSDGGVHSHITHLFALLEEAKKAGVSKCFVHFFADGRDTAPTSAGIPHAKGPGFPFLFTALPLTWLSFSVSMTTAVSFHDYHLCFHDYH